VGRFAKLAVWTALCLVSCGRGSPASRTEPGNAAGVPGIPAITRFRPPADGLLTDAQVDRYVRVRRAARGRSEEEAARAVGVDPEEFAWVRSRVVEALVLLDTAQVQSGAEATYARTIASLKEAARSVKDRETLRRLNEQVNLLERERVNLKAPEAPPAAVAANARRLAPRRADLEATRRTFE
jgi:hypothetical protein